MAEIRDELPQRDDRSQSGRFLFENNNVEYADDGIGGLIDTVTFDQGPWGKADADDARSLFTMDWDLGDSRRFHEKITPLALDAGVATIELVRRFQLPPDFGSFPADAFSLWVRAVDVSALIAAGASIYNASVNDSIISSLVPASDGVWQEFVADMPDVFMTYERGQWFTLYLAFTVNDLANIVSFGDLSIRYRTARGNV